MFQCIIYFIKYIEGNKNKKNMEKQLFMALGLHLHTEIQLYMFLCIIGFFELIIMLIILWLKGYFIEIWDAVILTPCLFWIVYHLFLVEHVTFFSALFYINLWLLIIYLICRLYKKTW